MGFKREAMGGMPKSTAPATGDGSAEEHRLVRILARQTAELLEIQRIAQVGIWSWALDTDRLEWSEPLFVIFGLDPTSELLPFTRHESLYDSGSWARLRVAVAATLDSGEPYELRLTIRHASGAPRWIDARGEPIRDTAGRIAGLRGSVHDITRSVDAELALQQSREHLSRQLWEIGQMYRDSPVGLFTFDREFRFLRINERMAEINGIPVEAHIGRSMREVVPHLAEPLETIMRPVLERGEALLGIEVHGRTAKAPEMDRNWLVNYHPMRDPSGVIVGLFGAVQEITDRKRAEESLRHSERRFRQLFEHSPIGQAIVLLDGRFEAVNTALCAITGYTAEELEELTFQAITIPEDLDDDLRRAADLLAGSIPSYQMEKRYRRKDGTPIWVQLNASLLRDDQGQPLRFFSQVQDISERKKLEHELRTERDRLRTVFDVAPSAILTIGGDGRIESANAMAEEVFGYPRADLEGMTVEQLIPMPHQAQHRALRDTYFSSGANGRQMTGRVVNGRHRDGREVPMEVRLSKYSDRDGPKVIAIATDRTEQLLLAESEMRWRTMAHSLPQLVWTCEAEGNCDFLSRRWVEYTGVPAEQQLGLGWIEQVHPEDRQRLTQCWQTAVATASDFEVEFRIRRYDDTYRWFDTRAIPLKDTQGRVLKWIGSNTDIEERRRAQAHVQDLNANLELRIEERTHMLDAARRDLRNILDALPSMVGYWDQQQRNRFANAAYLKWFGLTPEQVSGKTLCELLGAQIYDLNRDHIERALLGEAQAFEREIPGTDGVTRYSLARYIPDRVDGEVRGFYALVHDVTEVRRAQQAAEAASAAKSSFVANMSHEIRTPMNAVLGLMQLLLRTHLDPAQEDYVHKATNAARTLLGILNDVLDFSKIEAGKMALAPHPFSLDALMQELAVLLSTGRGSKAVEIVFEIDPAIPDALVGDSLRLKQVLLNLAGNALKFTSAGEVAVAVAGRRISTGQVSLLFTVRDTGIGMDAQQCKRIFEGFVQADAHTTRRFGGTGLGLAISQRLALLMGGELSVRSEPGAGSRFDFTVSLDCDESGSARSAPELDGLRVLLVEDHRGACAAMAGALQSCGARVEAHDDVGSALAAVEARQELGDEFQVALVKWPPANEDALRALGRIQGLPLIALCAEIGPLQAVQGCTPVCSLVKPLTWRMLASAIGQARSDLPSILEPKLTPAPGRRLVGLRLLVVEDNPTNQLVARGLLRGEGAQVVVAADGAAGVEAVGSTPLPFDLVLMDVQMPGMDGYTATRMIRELPPGLHLPIVAMTANALDADREACLASGMDDHVGKPFDLDSLVVTILRWCGRRAPAEIRPAVADPVKESTLNLPAALHRMSESREMYCEIASCFMNDAPRLMAEIEAGCDTGKRVAARRGAHTLRGLAGTLGAERLQTRSRQAEIALTGDDLPADWGHHLSALRVTLDETLRALDAIAHDGRPDAHDSSDSPVSPAHWDELERLLSAWNGDALSAFAAIRARYRCSDATALGAIGEAIESLDFAAALGRVRALRAALPASECPE
jgi:PAS domain S-box-containing protein